jgi:hypothetical protein
MNPKMRLKPQMNTDADLEMGEKHLIGSPSIVEKYGSKAGEVEKAAARDLAAIRRDRKAGRLKAWKL